MDSYDAVTRILTVREYDPKKKADKEIITKVLNAARMSPSAKNKQPWSFVVVTDSSTLLRIADLAQTGKHIGGAAFAVAVIIDPTNRWSEIDGARAVQSMAIEAWNEGMGCSWVGRFDEPKLKELLNIPPNLRLLTVIPFGFPSRKYEGKKKDRRPLDQIVYSERYGEKFHPAS